MICLSVVFFMFLLPGFAKLLGYVGLQFSPHLSNFQPLLLQISLLSSCPSSSLMASNYVYIWLPELSPYLPTALVIFISIFFLPVLYFRQFCCCFQIHSSFLLPHITYMLFLSSVYTSQSLNFSSLVQSFFILHTLSLTCSIFPLPS